MLSDYSFDESVLTSKQLTQFSLSRKAFDTWSESQTGPLGTQRVAQAVRELEAFERDQNRQLDEQLARQRDDATIAATIESVNTDVQKQWVRENPWFPLEPQVREVNSRILWERVLANAQSEGIDLEPATMADADLESFGQEIMRLLQKSAQQLWNSRAFYAIDFDAPHKHTPFSSFEPNYDRSLDPTPQYTNEEVEAALERGEISLDDVKAIADAQLMREAQAAAQARGEVFQRQTDIEMPLSIRQPAPESGSPKGNRGFAAAMYSSNVDRRRG